ncbi:polysaccharide biosynthesis tyrosine autokinase, partial [Coleofasciculus sp. FACHB-SPT36]|uniref:GumC family protein n=1 Tax=Coleofasciculus sp. FACHB-SPT36 TaxID=2692790 RepID=UPI0019AB56B1
MEANQTSSQQALFKRLNQAFDYKRLWANITNGWYWILASLFAALLIAFLYLRYVTPQYTVSATLLLDNKSDLQSQVLEKFRSQQDVGGQRDTKLFNEIFILKSPDLIRNAVDSLNLNVHYWVRGRVKENEIYEERPISLVFDSAGYRDDSKVRTLIVQQTGTGIYEVKDEEKTIRAAQGTWINRPWGRFYISELHNGNVNPNTRGLPIRLVINPAIVEVGSISSRMEAEAADGRTSMLNITLTDNLRIRALDFVNVQIDLYFKQSLENLTKSAIKTRDFINRQKNELVSQLKEKDVRVESIRRSTQIIDPAQPSSFIEGQASSRQRVEEFALQRQIVANLRASILASRVTGDRAVAGAGSVADPQLASLLTRYNEAVQRKESLEASNPEGNPLVQLASEQVARLRPNIISVCDRVLSNLDLSIRSASQGAAEFSRQISAVPGVDRSINDVKREYEVTQGTYLYLYEKGIENEIALYAATAPAKVVIAPNGSRAPVKPVPKMIYIVASLLGLFVPILVVVIRELLNNKIGNEKDIHAFSDVPIIGSVSQNASETGIVVGENIRTGIAEQFRLIRANMDFMSSSAGAPLKGIMITSSMSGEGKTFISMNLGLTLALTGKRVIVLEFDLRKPKITERLNLGTEGGISGYLAGLVSLEGVIKESGLHSNLFIGNCGPIPPNPGELLLVPRCAQLFQELREQFDYVVIDTA